jgi:threonine/homoserine/homoserine lactone efflux protein
MTDLLPSSPLLSVFLVASLVLAVTPGPGVLYIVTRSVAEGRKAGLASVIGVALGNLGGAIGASIGLAAIISASSVAFEVVRYLGALYLFFLGWKALRTHKAHTADSEHSPGDQTARVLRDGFVVALLNPKTALFFAAFLPQFVDADTADILQPLLLGTLFVLIAACTDTLYALFASLAAPHVSRTTSAVSAARFASAGAYFSLGLFAALAEYVADSRDYR